MTATIVADAPAARFWEPRRGSFRGPWPGWIQPNDEASRAARLVFSVVVARAKASTIALYRLKSKPPASLSSSTYVCNKNAATSDKDTTPSTACELASTTTSRRTPGKLNASTTARNVSPRVHVCARGVGNARCGGVEPAGCAPTAAAARSQHHRGQRLRATTVLRGEGDGGGRRRRRRRNVDAGGGAGGGRGQRAAARAGRAPPRPPRAAAVPHHDVRAPSRPHLLACTTPRHRAHLVPFSRLCTHIVCIRAGTSSSRLN